MTGSFQNITDHHGGFTGRRGKTRRQCGARVTRTRFELVAAAGQHSLLPSYLHEQSLTTDSSPG
jgi:hypothetical protein